MVVRRSRFSLERILEHMTAFTAPRHHDLVRAMVAEIESIADPAERRRFAAGAMAAIVRLTLSAYAGSILRSPGRFVGIPERADNSLLRGPLMPVPSTRQVLRRHVVPFAVTATVLTLLQLGSFAARELPRLSARGESAGTLVEVLLLAIPSTLVLTLPMAVFLAVSWVFTRLGKQGVLAAARREPHGIRRLIVPVLGGAAVIAALTLISNTQILPRANARFATVLAGAPRPSTDRDMTVGELRQAARNARAEGGPEAAARASAYEVEIQKKFALAAACLVLALAGAAVALRFPRGGVWLVIGAGGVVFTGYYVSLVAGEALADYQVVSPVVAMWMANALLLAAVLALFWRPGRNGPGQREALAVGA